jgi:tRNA pseudouridine65 synthase
MLQVVYQDDYIVAVNKPHGLLVHKSSIANDASEFALQIVRDQLGKHVYPVHRLDRKTGGLLIFALDEESLKLMQQLFIKHNIQKKYLAVVRGFTPESGIIDYPLKKENGTIQEALTIFRTLKHTEIDIPSGKHQTSRYSLVETEPRTGRMHQLRRHFAHIMHPIIGDRPHGCNKQNRIFKERWNMTTMLLHAAEVRFNHFITGKEIQIKAPLHEEFQSALSIFNFR